MAKGGKASRIKGVGFERDCVNIKNAFGLSAKRVPLSGAMAGYPGDIVYLEQGNQVIAECKVSKKKFKDLYDWLGGHPDVTRLIIKRAGKKALVVLPLDAYCVLASYK
jgi:hypothetical protein